MQKELAGVHFLTLKFEIQEASSSSGADGE